MKKRFIFLVTSLSLVQASAAAENCASLESLLHQSLEQNQIDTAASQLDKMNGACTSGNTLKNAQRLYTDYLARQANDLLNHDHVAEAEALLSKAKTLSWAVSSVRGDIAAKAKNWKEAAQQYGLAFELATDPSHVDAKEIPHFEKIQEKLYQLATDSQLVYGAMDASVKRGGEPSGILLAETRGFKIKQASVPVHFETGKASLTMEGKDSAEKLAAYIRNQSSVAKVIVLGYADPRGNPKDNQTLSQKRAETISAYLRQDQVNVPIEAHGRGSSTPPGSLLENLSPEEQWRLWRRVELQLIR